MYVLMHTFICFINPFLGSFLLSLKLKLQLFRLFFSVIVTWSKNKPPYPSYSHRWRPAQRCGAAGRAPVWSFFPGTAPPSDPGPHPAVAARSRCGPWSCCGESCCLKWPSLCGGRSDTGDLQVQLIISRKISNMTAIFSPQILCFSTVALKLFDAEFCATFPLMHTDQTMQNSSMMTPWCISCHVPICAASAIFVNNECFGY